MPTIIITIVVFLLWKTRKTIPVKTVFCETSGSLYLVLCPYPTSVTTHWIMCCRYFQWMCMFIDRLSRHSIMDSFAQLVFGVEVTWIDGVMFCFYFAQAHERLRILGKVFATKCFTKSGRLRWTKLETYPQSPVAIDSRFAGYTTKNKGIYRCRLKLK